MSRLEHITSPTERYRLETCIDTKSVEILESFRDIGRYTITDAINRTLRLQTQYHQDQAAGALWVVDDGKKVQPFAPPEEVLLGDDEEVHCYAVKILPRFHDLIAARIDTDDSYDLVGFWRSSIRFYSQAHEHHILEHTMHSIRPNMKIETYIFEPLNGQPPAKAT